MHRVVLPQRMPAGQDVELDKDDAHHLSRVLRARSGEAVWVSDGRGAEAEGVITRVEGDRVWIRCGEWAPSTSEPPIEVVLYQAVPKGDRMEWLIQKATEIGAFRIVPIVTRRSVARPEKGSRGATRRQRWERVAREAAKQIRRAWIPPVSDVRTFPEALEELGAGGDGSDGGTDGRGAENGQPGAVRSEGVKAIMPWEELPELSLMKHLQAEPARTRRVGIFIGPEGGWEPEEVERARAYGVTPVSMGPRVVRSETAGILALTLTLAAWGDLG